MTKYVVASKSGAVLKNIYSDDEVHNTKSGAIAELAALKACPGPIEPIAWKIFKVTVTEV